MARPGWIVAAEHEARDEALRRMEDITDGRDEEASSAPEVECDGCAVCRAVARRWGG